MFKKVWVHGGATQDFGPSFRRFAAILVVTCRSAVLAVHLIPADHRIFDQESILVSDSCCTCVRRATVPSSGLLGTHCGWVQFENIPCGSNLLPTSHRTDRYETKIVHTDIPIPRDESRPTPADQPRVMGNSR